MVVSSLQDTMEPSEENRIWNLLKDDIDEAELQSIVQKLHEDRINVHSLIDMPDSDLDDLIRDYSAVFTSWGAKIGFKVAIVHKRKILHGGAPPAKRSREEWAQELAASAAAKQVYFGKLLENPPTLPQSSDELKNFLSLRPIPLPTRSEVICQSISDPELVVLYPSQAENDLASSCDLWLKMPKYPPGNEATSSQRLANLTGNLMSILNREAPSNGKLQGLHWGLDYSDPQTSSVASKPLVRVDFQLRLRDCLVQMGE